MGGTLDKVVRRLHDFFQNFVSILERLLRLPSRFRSQPLEKQHSFSKRRRQRRSLDEFATEIHQLFTGHLTTKNLMGMADQIRTQLSTCAKTNPYCMLPSFNHTLPTGHEQGTFLALDVGGSTFRVALVQLSGQKEAMKIIRMTSSPIDEEVKALQGKAFFDWMAYKIGEMLDRGTEGYGMNSEPLPMGLSWSFPIDQTSIRSGKVIKMGKGFLCSEGTVGDDLSELIMEACRKRNVNVSIKAIVNDSSATLLSRAYADPSTRMSLILGTGTNVAIHFPIHAIGEKKFGIRSPEWFAQASHVIVNTELSMFGGGVLPLTRWDDDLNRNHIKPDYQPLEYMITGRYLGEILRLIIVDAVQTAGLFGGQLPSSMQNQYSFDTAIVSCIEGDTSSSFQISTTFIQKHHEFPVPPTVADMRFLQKVSKDISKRAAAYLSTAIYGLWCLKNKTEAVILPSSPGSEQDDSEPLKINTMKDKDLASQQVAIACDGSVINKYPNFRDHCQDYLNQLTSNDESQRPLSPAVSDSATLPTSLISLDPASESGIFGAAVAVAISTPEDEIPPSAGN